MQIFFVDRDPIKSAEFLYKHDKVRARKMMVEGVQLIANNCIHYGVKPPIKVNGKYYKESHPNHPLSLWMRKSTGNAIWLYIYLADLWILDGFKHQSIENEHSYNLYSFNILISEHIPEGKLKFENHAKAKQKNLDFTYIKNVHLAYRAYLLIQIKK